MTTATLRDFFQPELRRSRWFWITGTGQASVILLVAVTVARHWGRAELTSNAFLLLGLALTTSSWLFFAQEFQRIRCLPIDWEHIEPGHVVHSALESAHRLIQTGTLMPLLIAGVLVSSIGP